MQILITGITGRVGANVARKFLDDGHAVRGLVWPGDRQSKKMEAVGAEIVEGDLASAADVNAAAQDQEAILHLGAAFQAGGPFTPEQYFDTNVKGTFNILEAALGLGDRLQHIVVDGVDAGLGAIEFLREEAKGRAALVPRLPRAHDASRPPVPPNPAVMGRLIDRLRFAEADRGLIEHDF